MVGDLPLGPPRARLCLLSVVMVVTTASLSPRGSSTIKAVQPVALPSTPKKLVPLSQDLTSKHKVFDLAYVTTPRTHASLSSLSAGAQSTALVIARIPSGRLATLADVAKATGRSRAEVASDLELLYATESCEHELPLHRLMSVDDPYARADGQRSMGRADRVGKCVLRELEGCYAMLGEARPSVAGLPPPCKRPLISDCGRASPAVPAAVPAKACRKMLLRLTEHAAAQGFPHAELYRYGPHFTRFCMSNGDYFERFYGTGRVE